MPYLRGSLVIRKLQGKSFTTGCLASSLALESDLMPYGVGQAYRIRSLLVRVRPSFHRGPMLPGREVQSDHPGLEPLLPSVLLQLPLLLLQLQALLLQVLLLQVLLLG